MTLQDGWMLLGGVVVLYLFDSALLVYHNEIVLTGTRGGWLVSGGSAFELGGRRVFLPHPLCVHRPLFRLAWSVSEVRQDESALPGLLRVSQALRDIAPWTMALLLLFAMGLPCVLFALHAMAWLLAWLVSVYALIVGMLVHVYLRREALGLSGRAVAAIALDAMLCAPFALNTVRKIGLQQQFALDLREVATHLLSASSLKQLTDVLQARVTESLGFVEPENDPSESLRMYLSYFEGLRK